QKDKATGESRGVAIDLANELARRLGVPVEIVAYDSVTALGDPAPTKPWDTAFLGPDPIRETITSFSPAYVELEASTLAKSASPLNMAPEADRAGVRVSAAARANYELWLQRNLKNARLESVKDNDTAFEMLKAGQVDAYAGLAQGLVNYSAKLPGSRLL